MSMIAHDGTGSPDPILMKKCNSAEPTHDGKEHLPCSFDVEEYGRVP